MGAHSSPRCKRTPRLQDQVNVSDGSSREEKVPALVSDKGASGSEIGSLGLGKHREVLN